MKRIRTVVLLTLFIVLSGCTASHRSSQMAKVFFPPPPDPPRLQFLTSYTGAKDVEPPKSRFESFVTGEKDSASRLDKPYGVAVHDGKMYVCDTNGAVMVFDLKKKTYEPLQGAVGLGRLIQPINISIDKDGYKYVSDPVRGQIAVYDKNDLYVKALGNPGNWKPVDAVAYEDKIYVADILNGEIKVLDKETGDPLMSFGRKGKPEEFLDRPTNLVFDKEGYLYVSDAGRFQVVKFDRDGNQRKTYGRPGTNLGHFARPRGVAVDREGRVYVVDAAFYNVQIFNHEGYTLLFFGQGGTRPGDLILPAEIVVDYDNIQYFQEYVDRNFAIEHIIIVTSQFGERLVNVFAFGKEKGREYLSDDALLKKVKELQLRFEKKKQGSKKADETPKSN